MKRLKELREERNMTKAELAKATGIKARMIGHYEAGTREPGKISTIKIFCDYFGVTADYLLGFSEF